MIAHSTSDGKFGRGGTGRLLYRCALVLVFACAAWQRFSLPLDPIADPDTWGYLGPALLQLTGGVFTHIQGRNFLYPGFVFLLLRLFQDFRALTIAQHLLGLCAGVVFLLTWRRARAFLPGARVSLVACDGLGLLGAAILLFAAESIHMEAQLRPEGIAAFLISINLYALVEFLACRFVERRRNAALFFGLAAIFASLLLASAKPSFWFGAGLVFLFTSSLFWQTGWRRQEIALALGAGISAALLLLPEHFLSRDDQEGANFLPTTLFVMHGNFIHDQMAADLARGTALPYSLEWLERVQADLAAEIAKAIAVSPMNFPALGFDPDYLMYRQDSIATRLRAEFRGDLPALRAFQRFYYWRTWAHQPLRMLGKVARHFSLFYWPRCDAYVASKSTSLLTYEYARSVHALESYEKIWQANPAASEFMTRTKSLAANAPATSQTRLLRLALSWLAISYLPLLLLSLAFAIMIARQRDLRKRFGLFATLVLLAFAYNAVNCLEVAIVHTLDIQRYSTVQMYGAVLAEFLSLCFISELVLEKIGRVSRR